MFGRPEGVARTRPLYSWPGYEKCSTHSSEDAAGHMGNHLLPRECSRDYFFWRWSMVRPFANVSSLMLVKCSAKAPRNSDSVICE